jgi:beta-lactamase regulating signal transducer with metallopeptidase domain
MPYIAGYLLKLSVSLSVVYLFYVLVLRRLTFYTWNRWYLLGYSALAFFIPFVNISPVLENSKWDKSLVLQFIPVFSNLGAHTAAVPEKGFAWWSVLLIGAMTGILIMLVRFLVRYISFQRIRKSAQLMVDGGVKVYHVDRSIIPFSFGNAIFINPRLHSEEDLRQIIHHEFVHVKQKHTVDILWGELLCMLNWYNPFAWMIRKAMRQNLEFIADHKVLENGIDKKHYQYLLLKVTGAAHFSITQQFNFSSLKKRIIMMNRSRSARIQLTRFLFLLPLVTVLLLAFRQNVIKPATDTSSKDEAVRAFVAFKAKQAIDTLPRGKKMEGEEAFLKKNPEVKRLGFERTAAGKFPVVVVRRHDGTIEKYDWNDMQSRALLRKRYGLFPDLPENKIPAEEIKIIADTVIIDASLNGPGNPYLRPPAGDVLLVIDGVVQVDGTKKLNDIKPETIERVNILKGELAIQTYGDKAKGKDGVIEVETTNWPQGFSMSGSVSGKKDTIVLGKNDSIVLSGSPKITFRGKIDHPVPLYILDGKEYTPEQIEKLDIDPNTIESITVLKDEAAVKKYGEKARNGVIIIKLKSVVTDNRHPAMDDATRESLKGADEIVYVLNGNTYAITAGGSGGLARGVINTVIVDNKLYTIEEVNRLFKRSEFSSVGFIGAKTTLREHDKNEPALVLSRGGFDFKKYHPASAGSAGQQ